MSTSGRIHSEFLRLLYFLADKQASDYEPHKEEYCHRRGVYFHQHRCTMAMSLTRRSTATAAASTSTSIVAPLA